MTSIYIYNYNNYFNREVRLLETLAEYGTPLHSQNGVNFNPNDDVNTSLVVGKAGNLYDGQGDYLVVDEDGNLTRWFILDHKRKCKGQWIVALRRDVLADNYRAVLNADCYIQKGTVPSSSPFIYTQEPIPTNQIKTSEVQLKDSTGCAWLCGYISRSYGGGPLDMQISGFVPDETVNGIANWKYYNDTLQPSNHIISKQPIFRWEEQIYTTFYNNTGAWQTTAFEPAKLVPHVAFNPGVQYMNALRGNVTGTNAADGMSEQQWAKTMTASVNANGEAYFGEEHMTESKYVELLKLNGHIICDKSSSGTKYYKVQIVRSQNASKTVNISDNVTGANLYTEFYNLIQTAGGIPADKMTGFDGMTTAIKFNYESLRLQLTEVRTASTTVTMPGADSRFHLKDAPYDMFCIPYGEVTILNSENEDEFSTGIKIFPTESMQIAQEVARNVGKDNIYDLQLLPYCPMTGFLISGTEIDIKTDDAHRYTIVRDEQNQPTSILLWSTASQGTLDIVLDEPLVVDNMKISNQCDMYRLVSPNYNGQFEFNLAKNGGQVTFFNVDYTYLPYNSYIHVNPNFAGLYGQDYNDARGLICQGDFSVSYLSDAWANYQVNNKNYANIFARQISNLEVNHKYDMLQNAVGATAGAIGAGISAGVESGNVIAGVAAGVASAAAGAADLAITEQRYQEDVSYREDVFNMSLENIKAMPYSLASTTAYSANNKIFPILEYYTSTSEEKEQIARAIANTGMTLGIVGKPTEYVAQWSYGGTHGRGYIRAKPIHIELDDDYHLVAAISEELQKGVYFL